MVKFLMDTKLLEDIFIIHLIHMHEIIFLIKL